ncbi:MAG: MBL fold metallo-hydrolase [Rickettsiales bacterium]|jgi:L-ascorbate metabolism protein UlaG (beta-lactamase superfamily)|nr:MBL fold metallo-hydrolase [Rickettsiales bacterium]
MKITKYPQSCFMTESNGKRILIDAGNLSYSPEFADEWAKADAILITHKHGDHCYAEVLKNFNAPIYANSEVANIYPELKINVVKSGDVLDLFDNITATVGNAYHGYIPWLKGAGEIHENISWILEIENKKVYLTSDTICFKNDYKCDVLCAPVSAHGLVMSPFEVALFAKECGASLVLPCHADNPKFPVDFENLEEEFAKFEINYKLLKHKESIEI